MAREQQAVKALAPIVPDGVVLILDSLPVLHECQLGTVGREQGVAEIAQDLARDALPPRVLRVVGPVVRRQRLRSPEDLDRLLDSASLYEGHAQRSLRFNAPRPVQGGDLGPQGLGGFPGPALLPGEGDQGDHDRDAHDLDGDERAGSPSPTELTEGSGDERHSRDRRNVARAVRLECITQQREAHARRQCHQVDGPGREHGRPALTEHHRDHRQADRQWPAQDERGHIPGRQIVCRQPDRDQRLD
jgi:hypothetical protein